jgi:type IV pilus assembly protein PilC
VADFLCKVADASGHVSSQIEAAQSIEEAKQKLADRGLYVYSVKAQEGLLSSFLSRKRKRAVRGEDFLVFNQQFNTLIKAGLPIMKALDLLSERAASPKLRPLLAEVRRRVREGALLSEALDQQGNFPKIYTTSILAGERSGDLPGVLDQYIAYQRVSAGLKKKLISTLIYPTILVIAAISIVTYIVTYVLPQFAKLYSDMHISLPLTTRVLITLAVDYRPYVIAGFLAILLAAAAIYLWSRSERGGLALDKVKLRLPFVGETWIKFQVAQVMRTLSTLLVGGTPLMQALATAAQAAPSRLTAEAIRTSSQQVREGQSFHAALASTGIMPELALEMVEVGEASGSLPAMLNSVADFYEDEVNSRLAVMVAFIEPAILVVMGGVVAFILISLYLPIFSFGIGSTPGG